MKELNIKLLEGEALTYIKDNLLGRTIDGTISEAGNWLKAKLEEIETGYAKFSMLVRPEMGNPYKMIHGGMLNVLIDETIGYALLSLNRKEHFTTINLSTDFLYMAPVGTTIYSEAKVVRQGKRIVNIYCEVKNKEGVLIATATSNLVTITLPSH